MLENKAIDGGVCGNNPSLCGKNVLNAMAAVVDALADAKVHSYSQTTYFTLAFRSSFFSTRIASTFIRFPIFGMTLSTRKRNTSLLGMLY